MRENFYKYLAKTNSNPLGIEIKSAKGNYLYDNKNKKYLDFIAGVSVCNLGHCHPKITKALVDQAHTLTLTSRAFYNNVLGEYEKYMSEYFGFDKVLPMNTGAEGVETAIKVCRKWAYEKKGIKENEAQIIVCEDNFHGRTTTVVSFSSHGGSKDNFGPLTKGFETIIYNDISELKELLKKIKMLLVF